MGWADRKPSDKKTDDKELEGKSQNLSGFSHAKGVLKTYGESTSVKGIPKVLKTESKVLKVVWLLAVLVGLCTATYQVTTLIIR